MIQKTTWGEVDWSQGTAHPKFPDPVPPDDGHNWHCVGTIVCVVSDGVWLVWTWEAATPKSDQ